eukprot:CAMPEP_0184723246 /NCGR_PEP_ID=MMETSP0314-20130426/24610_1 /TAXON_ID=38298 /ORGANISM="Rhodella maculata, Strain CCMP 736" /LENGTH=104 /DNA_ID=CAMNT_0027188015 /DNA_START=57 /DNA_END=367 /DNA_ORIENTATION=+
MEQDLDKKEGAYTMRTRLREETEAPFRKVRLFIFGASAVSASLGAFISFSRLLAGLSHVPTAAPLSESLGNLAVNAGVIALAAFLISRDLQAGERRLLRMSRGA